MVYVLGGKVGSTRYKGVGMLACHSAKGGMSWRGDESPEREGGLRRAYIPKVHTKEDSLILVRVGAARDEGDAKQVQEQQRH
jgi:hypothetical protein